MILSSLEAIDGNLSKILPKGGLNFAALEKLFWIYVHLIESLKAQIFTDSQLTEFHLHNLSNEIRELFDLIPKRLKKLQFGFAECLADRPLEITDKSKVGNILRYLSLNRIGSRKFADLAKAKMASVKDSKVKKLYKGYKTTKSAMMDYHKNY